MGRGHDSDVTILDVVRGVARGVAWVVARKVSGAQLEVGDVAWVVGRWGDHGGGRVVRGGRGGRGGGRAGGQEGAEGGRRHEGGPGQWWRGRGGNKGYSTHVWGGGHGVVPLDSVRLTTC